MTTLHLVNKSPFERTALESCLGHALPGDAVLLFEDAVYGAAKGTAVGDRIAGLRETVKIYVLGPDVSARGLSSGRLVEGVEVVDYPGFVDLVTTHGRSHSWL
ncbi:MAG: sulfurtransferase complex subunit TusB [Hyphomicrobiaceae bacterium]|nr:sulfurtransferase complex subunit TusB [Hyphomicrobiaceae bacterium]